MGRAKGYRQRLKYLVGSARKKTVENQIAVELVRDLGMSETEARLLSHRMGRWLLARPEVRGPRQVVVEAMEDQGSFVRNGRGRRKKIKLTAFDVEDLDLHLEFGLVAMQLGRVLRLVEEAQGQGALLSAKELGLMCNITPTSLRARLREARDRGMWVPVLGLSRKERTRGGLPRSTWAMAKYLEGGSVCEIRRVAAMSRERFREAAARFGAMARSVLEGGFEPGDPGEARWVEIVRRAPPGRLEPIMHESFGQGSLGDWPEFRSELAVDFGLSPVKVRALREIIEELEATLSAERPGNEVVYWAVSSSEPAGKPPDACRLVPVRLALLDPEDTAGEPENRVSGVKHRKIVRYATQAKFQGAYLTYADVGYLMGIHTEAIRRLVARNPKLVLVGLECQHTGRLPWFFRGLVPGEPR